MKSVLLSKQPQIVANVLNENSKLLVCKKFPVDYVGWVYIYCTKGRIDNVISLARLFPNSTLNEILGKVVARFWCEKVEEIGYCPDCDIPYQCYSSVININKESCLTNEQLEEYIGYGDGYAIHISKLEIFDKPRELREFSCRKKQCDNCSAYSNSLKCVEICAYHKCNNYLTKAPQNYCYIEGEE